MGGLDWDQVAALEAQAREKKASPTPGAQAAGGGGGGSGGGLPSGFQRASSSCVGGGGMLPAGGHGFLDWGTGGLASSRGENCDPNRPAKPGWSTGGHQPAGPGTLPDNNGAAAGPPLRSFGGWGGGGMLGAGAWGGEGGGWGGPAAYGGRGGGGGGGSLGAEEDSGSPPAWDCPRCTLRNEAACLRCVVCERDRPGRPPPRLGQRTVDAMLARAGGGAGGAAGVAAIPPMQVYTLESWERKRGPAAHSAAAEAIRPDLEAVKTWQFPPMMRDYQFSTARKALTHNTLMCLPTGLGKTLVAAAVMGAFYRWFPNGRILFLAPTRSLVRQQRAAVLARVPIPRSATAEITGAATKAGDDEEEEEEDEEGESDDDDDDDEEQDEDEEGGGGAGGAFAGPSRGRVGADTNKASRQRGELYNRSRVFFATAQCITNDLRSGVLPAASVVCVVIDEAHRAGGEGNHAYVKVVEALQAAGGRFRVLALSATPGNNYEKVQNVICNLRIAHIDRLSEDDAQARALARCPGG